MTTYKSEQVELRASADTAYDKICNLDNLKRVLENVPEDKIPADKREMFDNLKIDSDSISLPGGPVGNIRLEVTKREAPHLIALQGAGTPVDLGLVLRITPKSETSCLAQVELNINIPAMLKPMIGGTLQKVVDQFALVLGAIPLDK